MNNKVLIKLIVPEFDVSFDVFVPVNELVWKIKRLIIKSVSDLTGTNLDINADYILLNKINCNVYSNNDVLINTDIRNGTELILISGV